jgi:2-hydroxy-3-oxopropionate reductase
MTAAERVGVIGLGVLGRPIAERLRAQGCAVAVYDVREEPVAALAAAGAAACASPAEVASRSDYILTLVSDEAQTQAVLGGEDGVLARLREDTVIVIGSTLTPDAVRGFGRQIAARGGAALDAPISGGYLAARDGTLSMMIGGSEAVVARAHPVLARVATRITHVGELGAGEAAKLAHQLVFSVNVMALLEGLALGAAAGVRPEVLKRVLGDGIAASGVLALWPELGSRWKAMLEASPAGAPPPNMRKDLHLVLELARELGVTLYMGTQASLVADAGVATGHADPKL